MIARRLTDLEVADFQALERGQLPLPRLTLSPVAKGVCVYN